MIAEGKTGKYLKYALGEILLVVIGILIALQINNWNEAKKERTFEMKMLTEIEKALESDIDYYKMLENRMERLDSASGVFLTLVHEKGVFEDSLYKSDGRTRWYGLRTGINLQSNTGPYEALKSSGLDKISNDSLRNALVYFYDFRLPIFNAFIEYASQDYEEDVATLLSFLDKPYTEMVDGKIEVYSKFPEDLFQKEEFLRFLMKINGRAINSKQTIAVSSKYMVELKNHINNEISP
ncbi:hypothetical protein BWZ20_02460 [Winogradskyella sp. J14-2]|nr:hypothetical protein BWZ20_02460 [Winogradskyella sp. J14-2]